MKQIMIDILAEYESASSRYPPFHSTHEGFAVLKEEVDELWDMVKRNKGIKGDVEMKKRSNPDSSNGNKIHQRFMLIRS